jgi:hypothetical protein
MKRSTRTISVVATVSALAVLALAASPAWAGPRTKTPPTSSGSSIWLASVNGIDVRGAGTAAGAWAQPELALGDDLRFGSTVAPLAGWEYPMVAVSCYQDVDGDGTVDQSLTGPDVVFTWLDTPAATFRLGGYASVWTQRGGGDAACRADLDAYGTKGGKQTIRVLQSLPFTTSG